MPNMARDIDDIVFEDRNKNYGAYLNRKNYPRNMMRGLLMSIVILILLILTQFDFFSDQDLLALPREEFVAREVNLVEPPAIDPTKAAPPAPPKVEQPKNLDQVKIDEEQSTSEVVPDKTLIPSNSSAISASNTAASAPQDTPSSSSASGSTSSTNTGEERAFQIVDNMPIFPGCEVESDPIRREDCTKRQMTAFIQSNLKYPDLAIKNNTQGEMIVQFVVEKDGSISNVKIIKGLGDGTEQAAQDAIRLLNTLSKRITPGNQQGRAVRVKYNIKLNWKLNNRSKG